MAKGISLEEFKSKLDTDAQLRCLNQEKTIKELHEQEEELKELLKDKEVVITQLQIDAVLYLMGCSVYSVV